MMPSRGKGRRLHGRKRILQQQGGQQVMSASISRREFVSGVGGAAIVAGLPELIEPEQQSPARVVIDTERKHAPIDRRLFGSFIEHLGRAVYEGIYDPGNRLSDSK